MSSHRTRVPSDPSARPSASPYLASWYMPGFSDGLGSRLLMFDNTRAPAWELLRLRTEFTAAPSFESALRQQIEQLATVRHPAFSTVRCVDQRASGGGLAVVSSFGPGRRLSETLERPRSAGSALHVIREVTPALAAMHRHGFVHGVLTVDRTVLAPRGLVGVRDHALGSAIQTLGWSPARLWVELGIITSPESAAPTLSRRNDVIQLGLMALSVMLGRRVDFSEYPGQIDRLFERVAKTASPKNPAVFQALRTWLERALQLAEPPFESAEEADEALRDWSDDASSDDADFELPVATASTRASLFGEQSARRLPPQPEPAPRPAPSRSDAAAGPVRPVRADVLPVGGPVDGLQPTAAESVNPTIVATPVVAPPIIEARPVQEARSAEGFPASDRQTPRPAHTTRSRPGSSLGLFDVSDVVEEPTRHTVGAGAVPGRLDDRSIRALQITAAASLLVAAVEAVALVYLLAFRAPAAPPVSQTETVAQQRPESPAPATAQGARASEAPPVATSQVPRRAALGNSTAGATANRQRAREPLPSPATVRVLSPIDLQIFQGQRRLGSTQDAAIELPAGRHRLLLVNTELGFSAQRVVEVAAGQALSLNVTPANGRVNINATPWAEVWVNGLSIGVTPLAAISLPLGEHEFLFRHPQLGEQRRKARVRTGVTLVTVSLGS